MPASEWNRATTQLCGSVVLLRGGLLEARTSALNLVTAENNIFRVEATDVVVLRWPSGKTALIWLDFDGPHTGTAGPFLEGVVYKWSHREVVKVRQEIRAGAPKPPQPPMPPMPPQDPNAITVVITEKETNRGADWRLVTPGGESGTMTIGTDKFDLAEGNVFLVSTPGWAKVTQLKRDLSGLGSEAGGLGRPREDGCRYSEVR